MRFPYSKGRNTIPTALLAFIQSYMASPKYFEGNGRYSYKSTQTGKERTTQPIYSTTNFFHLLTNSKKLNDTIARKKDNSKVMMLNGPFIPVFNDFDDGFMGNPYSRSHGGYGFNPMSARRALEERQRQAEMEKYKQWKQQQRLLHQREQEEQEAIRQRLAQEEYLRRRLEAEQLEKLRPQPMPRIPEAYAIVHGPGGRLYRVPVEQHKDTASISSGESFPERRVPRSVSPPTKQPRRTEQPTYVRGPDGRIYIVKQPEGKMDNSESTINGIDPETSDTSRLYDTQEPNDGVTLKINPSSTMDTTEVEVAVDREDNNDTDGKNHRRLATVILEDVPESEYEDETKSIWRTRRPGPGESWMEPINL
jgi:hypothetical protein